MRVRFGDLVCPACRQFEQNYGNRLHEELEDGSIRVHYHLLNLLDDRSDPPGYSLLAANAALAAADAARTVGVRVWGLTGPRPNPLAARCDEVVAVASGSTATVQEVHLVVIHLLCAAIDAMIALRDLEAVRGWWPVIRGEIADVLVSLVDDSGVIAADSSIWEVHWNGRQRRFTYTSPAAGGGPHPRGGDAPWEREQGAHPPGAGHREFGSGDPVLEAKIARKYGVPKDHVYLAGGTSLANFVTLAAFSPRGGVVGDVDERPAHALEANIRSTGRTLTWPAEVFGVSVDALRAEAATAASDGVTLVPAFGGLGAPWWDPDARAALIGLTRDSGRAHIVRAALESVAYQTRDLARAFELYGESRRVPERFGDAPGLPWLAVRPLSAVISVVIYPVTAAAMSVAGRAYIRIYGATYADGPRAPSSAASRRDVPRSGWPSRS